MLYCKLKMELIYINFSDKSMYAVYSLITQYLANFGVEEGSERIKMIKVKKKG